MSSLKNHDLYALLAEAIPIMLYIMITSVC